MTPITIATILLGAGAYVAAVNHWPVVSPIMYWVALQAYQRVPALERYNFAQAPYVVSALIVAGVFFCVATSFAPLLAQAFTRAGIKNLEKQTAQLKQHRAKLKKSAGTMTSSSWVNPYRKKMHMNIRALGIAISALLHNYNKG